MASPGRLHGSVNCFQLITVFLLTFINSAFSLLLQPLHPSSSQRLKDSLYLCRVHLEGTMGASHCREELLKYLHRTMNTAPTSPTSCPCPQHQGNNTQQPHLPSNSRTGTKAAAAALAPSTHTAEHNLAHISTVQTASTQEKGHSTYCTHMSWPTEAAPGAPAEPALLLLHRACRLPALLQPQQRKKVGIKSKCFLQQHQQEALS